LERHAEDIDTIKSSIKTLAGESEKAREAIEKIEVLDNALEEIEERITSMQRARQWVADAETRFEALNRQAQIQIDSLRMRETKETVITLTRQHWTVDEIVENLKISRGEVELILDMSAKEV
jgi:DNA-binding transcriptional regulator GbsR (MarR family)